MGRVVLEITIPAKELLGELLVSKRFEERTIELVLQLYIYISEEAFSVIVKVEEHKGVSGVKLRREVVAEQRRTRTLQKRKHRKPLKKFHKDNVKCSRGRECTESLIVVEVL